MYVLCKSTYPYLIIRICRLKLRIQNQNFPHCVLRIQTFPEIHSTLNWITGLAYPLFVPACGRLSRPSVASIFYLCPTASHVKNSISEATYDIFPQGRFTSAACQCLMGSFPDDWYYIILVQSAHLLENVKIATETPVDVGDTSLHVDQMRCRCSFVLRD